MSDSSNQPPVPSSWNDAEDGLDSWKEIALYLDRDLSTVRRWEKEEGLPVHRHVHNKRSTVYAYRSEIDTWRKNRSSALGNDRPGWFRFFSENRRIVAAVTTAALLLLATLVTTLDFQEREWNTSSPQALELFKKAEALMIEGRSGQGPAEELLKQAIAKDPEFASAHIFLARAIRDQDKPANEYMNHAERAVQLAGTISDRERYFIHGSYFGMKGESEKAIHNYQALLSLYPDHFWAINDLTLLYMDSGQEQEYLTYALRCATLRPNSFFYNSRAARLLSIFGDDFTLAESYVDLALKAITSRDLDSHQNLVDFVMLFPAFQAFLSGDPQTALIKASEAQAKLGTLGGVAGINFGKLYLALGKLKLAKEHFKRPPFYLAAVAYIEGDQQTLEKQLRKMMELSGYRWFTPNSRVLGPLPAMLLVNVGLFSEAESLFDVLEQRFSGSRADELNIAKGVLALRRGEVIAGTALIENTLPLVSRPGSAGSYFMASVIVANELKQQGDLDKALRYLEEASEKGYLLIGQSLMGGPLWLETQAQLAQLYREMGRDEEARKIEAELRSLLAYADADHPILRQLDRTKEVALRGPTDN